MSLILKQEAANTVPTPSAGKGTIFLNTSDQLVVKDSAGNTQTFLAFDSNSNTSVLFNDAGAVGTSNTFTFNKTANTLTVGNLSITGTLTAGSIAVDKISNGNSNVNIPASNGNVTISAVGNANIVVVTGTGANIAGTLSVSGNSNVGNLATGGILSATGNITGGNVNTSGKVVANTLESNVANGTAPLAVSSQTLVANLNADLLDGYNTSTTATANTVAVRNADGNLSANYFIGNGSQLTGIGSAGSISNGTSNISIPVADGNINLSVGGNSNIAVITGTGVNIAGTLNATGNGTVGGNLNVTGNALISGNLTVDGNLVYVNVDTLSVEDPIVQLQTGPNGAAPVANSGKDVGTALNYYDSSAKIAFMGWDVSNAEIAFGANVSIVNEVVTFTELANIRSGNAQLGNLATANFVSGTLTTAAQPNITSTGTLSSLTVTGNVTGGNFITAGSTSTTGNANVGNLGTSGLITATGNITGGNLTTSGTISTANANITGQITGNLIPSADVTYNLGSANFRWNDLYLAGNTLILGNISLEDVNGAFAVPAISVTGNANIGNIGTGGLVTATGNITGANLTTGGLVTATGNVTGGNLTTGGLVTATGNITGANLTTGGLITATGNITGANLTTGGLITATGNVTGGNIITGGLVTATGNVTAGNISTAGSVSSAGKVTMGAVAYANTDGTGGQVLTTYGNGITYWSTVATGTGSNISNGTSNVSIAAVNGNVTVGVGGTANVGIFTSTGANITGTLSVSGNATVGNLLGVFANGNSNVSIPAANGNINLSAAGNANVLVITGTGANITGTLSASGNITAGNITTGGGSGGNITGANVISANTFNGVLANGNSNVSIPAANGNVNISAAGNANVIVVGGNVIQITKTTNFDEQIFIGVDGSPKNINLIGSIFIEGNSAISNTRVGNLTELSVSGNSNVGNLGTAGSITSTGKVTMGTVAYANTDGTNGQVLTTYGNGITYWSTISAGSTSNISNGNSNVNIPSANGNITMSAVGNANVVVVTGTGVNVAGTLNATGNGTVGGNLNVTGNAIITGNLTVDGNLVYVNVDTLAVEDPIIQLQTGPNGAAPVANSGKDVGTALNYYDTAAKVAFMGWDVSNAEMAFGSNVTITNEVVTFNSLANIRSGNAQLGNLATANFVSGTLTTAAQPNVTSLGTLSSLTVTSNISAGNLSSTGSLSVTGNATVGNLLGIFANGNSNVSIPAANGNVNISAAGNANILVITGTGANISGTLSASGNITGANLIVGAGSGGNLTGANVISANTFTGTFANGNSNVSIPAANGNVNISAAGNANVLIVTGTGVNVAGTFQVTGVSNLGPVGNLIITGGSNGQVLTTNGSGNLSWATASGGLSLTDDTSTNANYYITLTTATSGSISSANVSSTKLYYNPSSGQLNATDFNSLSDIRFKTNLTKLDNVRKALDTLSGYSFDWLDGTGSSYGVIAQEVEKVMPKAVSGEDRKTVNYAAIMAFIVEAIKDIYVEIDKIKKDIT